MLFMRIFTVLVLMAAGFMCADDHCTSEQRLLLRQQWARTVLERGKAAYEGTLSGEPDYLSARQALLLVENQNYCESAQREALLLLGCIALQGGYGVEQDVLGARGYFARLVDLCEQYRENRTVFQEDERELFATAYFYLGIIAQNGTSGTASDWYQASKLFEHAYRLAPDCPLKYDAVIFLGKLYLLGHETLIQDFALAYDCFFDAYTAQIEFPEFFSERNKAEIYCCLGEIAEHGIVEREVSSDASKALEWFMRSYETALSAGDDFAYHALYLAALLLLNKGAVGASDAACAIFYLSLIARTSASQELQNRSTETLAKIEQEIPGLVSSVLLSGLQEG